MKKIILLLLLGLSFVVGSTLVEASPVVKQDTSSSEMQSAHATTNSSVSTLQKDSVSAQEEFINLDDPGEDYLETTNKWGERYYKTWLEQLSPEEKNALYRYTDTDDILINCYLRGFPEFQKNVLPKTLTNIELIKTALSRAKVPHDLVVYKGIRDIRLFGDILEFTNDGRCDLVSMLGKEFTNPAFMSTSIVGEAAWNTKITWVINVPKNAEGAYISPISEYPDEAELLLNANQKLKITEIYILSEDEAEFTLDLILDQS